MNYYNNKGLQISGWPGYFEEIRVKESSWNYNKENRIDSVLGIVRLYPSIKDRYIYKDSFGHVDLDLFFQCYTDEKIKSVIKTSEKKPLIFWGCIDERFETSKYEYKEYGYKLDIYGFCDDDSRGKVSPTKAVLLSSCDKELVR